MYTLELHGLTEKQKAFCDIMWAIETMEGVESFISTLPSKDQRDCRSLIEMMQLAFTDNIDSTDLAEEVIANIKQKL
jgi:hypothetical protein